MRNAEINAQDAYLLDLLPQENAYKQESRHAAQELGLERISLSPIEGNLIAALLSLHGCKKCVEIGTLTGLSAQYILDALSEDGELWTFEKSTQHAERAQKIFSRLPLAGKQVHLLVGDAQEKLQDIVSRGPFDAVFIDGNKAAYGNYLQWAEANLRTGGMILADNVFLSGSIWGAETKQKFNLKQIQGMQAFNKRLADPRLYTSTLIPTLEGLHVAIKKF